MELEKIKIKIKIILHTNWVLGVSFYKILRSYRASGEPSITLFKKAHQPIMLCKATYNDNKTFGSGFYVLGISSVLVNKDLVP